MVSDQLARLIADAMASEVFKERKHATLYNRSFGRKVDSSKDDEAATEKLHKDIAALVASHEQATGRRVHFMCATYEPATGVGGGVCRADMLSLDELTDSLAQCPARVMRVGLHEVMKSF